MEPAHHAAKEVMLRDEALARAAYSAVDVTRGASGHDVAAQAMNAASLRDYKRLMGVAGSKGDAHIDVHRVEVDRRDEERRLIEGRVGGIEVAQGLQADVARVAEQRMGLSYHAQQDLDRRDRTGLA